MKKIVSIFLFFTILFFSVACNNSKNNSDLEIVSSSIDLSIEQNQGLTTASIYEIKDFLINNQNISLPHKNKLQQTIQKIEVLQKEGNKVLGLVDLQISNAEESKEIEMDKITSGLMALQKTIIESIKSSSAGEANLELITEELNLTNYTLSGMPLENKIALKSIKLRISRALYLSSSILKAEVSLDPNHEKKIGVLN